MLLCTGGVFFSGNVQARDAGRHIDASTGARAAGLSGLHLNKRYALGIRRFDLDAHTEIIGWQLRESWFLGRQDGLDSGLTLVWQRHANQISLSKNGIRVTHRF